MRKSNRSQINEINVVPYVDVMLVLLVVFMVTAPLLVQGIKIDLPETTASVLEESELEELTLTINKKGQFFIEFESYKNKSFSIDTLKPVLEDIFKINNNMNVYGHPNALSNNNTENYMYGGSAPSGERHQPSPPRNTYGSPGTAVVY